MLRIFDLALDIYEGESEIFIPGVDIFCLTVVFDSERRAVLLSACVLVEQAEAGPILPLEMLAHSVRGDV